LNKHQIRTQRTREKIILAAEPLFAELDFQGVSMRQIAAAADVDLSLVMYHFGSKAKLYDAVLDRLLTDFTATRVEKFDALEARTETPSAIELFDVWLSSWLRLHFGPDQHHADLLTRGMFNKTQPEAPAEQISDPLVQRFLKAVGRAEPEFTEEEIHWIYHAVTGALVYFLSARTRIERISGAVCDPSSMETVRAALLRLVRDSFSPRAHRPLAQDLETLPPMA
jgi:AcrR family transcriptional regulator